VDAKGKHLTSGIIDEHSHIAILKWWHNLAEVTIQDVVNSEDINIYRELAGGVTTSQLLHGSATYRWTVCLLNGNGDKMQMKCFIKPT
jgi:hypothetical protein